MFRKKHQELVSAMDKSAYNSLVFDKVFCADVATLRFGMLSMITRLSLYWHIHMQIMNDSLAW